MISIGEGRWEGILYLPANLLICFISAEAVRL